MNVSKGSLSPNNFVKLILHKWMLVKVTCLLTMPLCMRQARQLIKLQIIFEEMTEFQNWIQELGGTGLISEKTEVL